MGWVQSGQVAGVLVDAPPDPFAVQTPADFVRTVPELRWDPPAHAVGGVKFAVTVDDDTVAEGVRGTRVTLKRGALDDGVSVVQVVAEDAGGQETTSLPAELKLDRRKPRVRFKRYRNRLVEVRLSDGPRASTSGVEKSSVRVAWGDGKRSSGRARLSHRYTGPGPFRVTVAAADAAGNRVQLRRQVRP